jgi:RNA polymerase sigma-70 factor (ECF subfamily)
MFRTASFPGRARPSNPIRPRRHFRSPGEGRRAHLVLTALQRFCSGADDAFDELVDTYASSAYAVAYRVLEDQQLAEEAVQEAFVRVWERARAFDSTRGTERTWVLSVVRNQAIDVLRKRQRQRERSIDDEPVVYELKAGDDVWREVLQRLTGEQVRTAVDALPSDQRATVRLAYFDGLRPVEIARQTGVPEGTVRSRLRLGLQRLRHLLSDFDRGTEG